MTYYFNIYQDSIGADHQTCSDALESVLQDALFVIRLEVQKNTTVNAEIIHIYDTLNQPAED